MGKGQRRRRRASKIEKKTGKVRGVSETLGGSGAGEGLFYRTALL